MKARDQLAAAHAKMTPEEIARHALAMTDLIETLYRNAGMIIDAWNGLAGQMEEMDRRGCALHAAIAKARTLHVAGRKREARETLDAAVTALPWASPGKIDRMEMPPIGDAFNPVPNRK